jgi:hypothetical protein
VVRSIQSGASTALQQLRLLYAISRVASVRDPASDGNGSCNVAMLANHRVGERPNRRLRRPRAVA